MSDLFHEGIPTEFIARIGIVIRSASDLVRIWYVCLITPLMRLQDSTDTRIILVTLPETTPVSEAGALQEDLRRAEIEPFAWVINRSLLGSGTQEPLLVRRMASEKAQIERVRRTLAHKTFILPW